MASKTKKQTTKNIVHTVSAEISVQELAQANSGIKLEVKSEKAVLGRLDIGRGSITWIGKNRKVCVTLPWPQFAKLMDELYRD